MFGNFQRRVQDWFGRLKINAGTVKAPALEISQTWNDSNYTCTGIKANIIDKALSNYGNLIDFSILGQVTNSFKIIKTGSNTIGLICGVGCGISGGGGSIAIGNYCTCTGLNSVAIGMSNSASGYYSSAPGGYACTASGTNSFSSGYFNTASGHSSVAIGGGGTASNRGQISFGNSFQEGTGFASGASQSNIQNFVTVTTTADSTKLNIINSATERMVIPAKRLISIIGLVNAFCEVSGSPNTYFGKAWEIRAVIKRDNSNNTAIVGTPTITELAKDADGTPTPSTWSVASITADDTNEALEINVTGQADTTIRWHASLFYAQVGF